MKKGKISIYCNIAYIDIITKLEIHVCISMLKTPRTRNAYKMNRKTQNNNNCKS
ncbi:hypothetical protein [Borreliella bavariensis]|uniref:hypothetical protein n=1 Tax=Borreliella bavariensis TaxID=664662 RepID=UPI001F47CF1E|nr:hypothetical protein [Borreliella bavariensis]